MIIFYHEEDSVSGGAAVLIVNLIRGLSSLGEKIVLFNIEGGALAKELSDVSTDSLVVLNNDKNTLQQFAKKVKPTDYIVTTLMYTVYKYFIAANPKFFLYCVGHLQIIETNKFRGYFNFLWLSKQLMKHLHHHKSVVMIESNASRESEKIMSWPNGTFPILPIPVILPEINHYVQRKWTESETVSFTYVGRATESKMYPVLKMTEDILAISDMEIRVLLHIVTDNGAAFAQFLDIPDSKNLEICYHENLSQSELSEFLLNHSQMHFSHGTAALDGAKLGIPTILIDFAFEKFPKRYGYKFIYETGPDNIAVDANTKANAEEGRSMKELVSIVRQKEQLLIESRRAYNFIEEFHELNAISKRLLEYLRASNSPIQSLRKYLLRYWITR